jgi:hypothetical protein
MTGQILQDTSDGIYDDGEWISWDWINQQIYEQELRANYPKANPELAELFNNLVDLASRHHEITGRYLQIWGELGELYAELKFGIKRHRPKAPGSDGRLGNDFIEIKTISPEKSQHKVQVKRAGNFNKLLVVRISEAFAFEARIIERHKLKKGTGKHASVSWQAIPSHKESEA